MPDITVNLTEDLKTFVESQVDRGEYQSASEYIATLLARARDGEDRLESLLIEGIDSGQPITLGNEERDKIRREVRDRLTG